MYGFLASVFVVSVFLAVGTAGDCFNSVFYSRAFCPFLRVVYQILNATDAIRIPSVKDGCFDVDRGEGGAIVRA